MPGPVHPATVDISFVEVMHALADPVRLEIVSRLDRQGEESCGTCGDGIDLHKSTLSHHYRVLRESGVTTTRVDGRQRLVCLRRDDLNGRFPGLLDAVLAAISPAGAAPVDAARVPAAPRA
ncbi:MAG: helix-turn-helix transcriptional regulator [Candidatus Dormiibacterota bacterium]